MKVGDIKVWGKDGKDREHGGREIWRERERKRGKKRERGRRRGGKKTERERERESLPRSISVCVYNRILLLLFLDNHKPAFLLLFPSNTIYSTLYYTLIDIGAVEAVVVGGRERGRGRERSGIRWVFRHFLLVALFLWSRDGRKHLFLLYTAYLYIGRDVK